MLDQKTTGSYRWAKLSSTLCCVVTILCGILNLAAWGAHAADQTIAATLVLNGLAVLGIASGRSRIAKVCSASAAAVAALSVASFLFPPIREFAIPAGPAFCFGLLAISLLWPGNTGGQMSSSRLGIGGSLMVALSLGSVIELFSGTSHSFRSLIEMSLPIAVGCLFLGLGITGTAWDLSQPAVREPIWLPAGATLAVATVRFALWEALSDRKTHIFSIGTLMGG